MGTYRQALEYLDSLVDYEKKPVFNYARSLKLEHVCLFLHDTGIAYPRLKVIHVAGTKGKGSTAVFAASILAASGYKVGLYTSPHFTDIRERIVIVSKKGNALHQEKISRNDFARIIHFIKKCIAARTRRKVGENLSFFEVCTVGAFKYFLEQCVDVAVLEVGLGGRLDATNVVTPQVSVITRIGYDHTDKLGKKLTHIAREKAGIIKPGVPVVVGFQEPAVLGVLRRQCRANHAPAFVLGEHLNFSRPRLDMRKTCFDFRFDNIRLDNAAIHLRGEHQLQNASLAIAAVHLLHRTNAINSKPDYRKGLSAAIIEGRFEVVQKNPLVIVDVAHNVPSFVALNRTIKRYYPQRKVILIFGVSQDKDVSGMLSEFDYDTIILTSFSSPRSLSPLIIRDTCRLQKCQTATNITQALKKAYQEYNKNSLILVAGSFFLAAEAKKVLQKL